MSKEYTEAFEILLQHIETEADWSDYEKVKNAHKLVEQALQRLESIDNAKPSEAVMKLNLLLDRANHDEILSRKSIDFCEKWLKEIQEAYNIIKQALLKAQEPKQYLKWEDLEWEELKTVTRKDIKVNLNGVEYGLEFAINFGTKEVIIFDEKEFMYAVFNECHKQFFNDLRLERVEE